MRLEQVLVAGGPKPNAETWSDSTREPEGPTNADRRPLVRCIPWPVRATGKPRHWPKRRFVGAVSRMRCSSPGLQVHSKSKTPVAKISKLMKRTEGAIRQRALALDISIGHRR